jgi:hypothetical protein
VAVGCLADNGDGDTRPDNGNETGGSTNRRRVSVLSMMETFTSTGDNGTETWKQVQYKPRTGGGSELDL